MQDFKEGVFIPSFPPYPSLLPLPSLSSACQFRAPSFPSILFPYFPSSAYPTQNLEISRNLHRAVVVTLGMGFGLPMSITLKYTGQESPAELCEIINY